jgi:hypothetical protein
LPKFEHTDTREWEFFVVVADGGKPDIKSRIQLAETLIRAGGGILTTWTSNGTIGVYTE